MTKTEQVLIERAASHRCKRGSVQIGYRTYRKNSFYGSRESAALRKLVNAGKVRIVSQQNYVISRNRFSDHYTETIYELIGG
jgi:hypothetical protein